MGTTFRIVLYAADEPTAKKAAKAAFARVAELNRILSDYLPDSELMQLCKQAGGDPVKVSDDLFAVLRKSEEIAKLSDGALRCGTSAPSSACSAQRARRSNSRTWTRIKQALARVDFRKIRLDGASRRTVQLLIANMLLDWAASPRGTPRTPCSRCCAAARHHARPSSPPGRRDGRRSAAGCQGLEGRHRAG